jgi:hypothetical protein
VICGNEFIENFSEDNGGAIFFETPDTNISFSNCIFEGNAATRGGAIWSVAATSIAESTFTGNEALINGGALYLIGSGPSLVIESSSFTCNSTGGSGGAILVSRPTHIDECEIVGNQADLGGGIFFGDNSSGSTLSGTDTEFNTIADNTATEGSAIYWAVPFQSNGSGDLAADHVCWGTESQAELQQMVFDFFDDASFGVVATFPLIEDCDVPPADCDPCPADLDGSGMVDVADLLDVLAAWGEDPGGPPDFDMSGSVDVADLLTLLAEWGPCE